MTSVDKGVLCVLQQQQTINYDYLTIMHARMEEKKFVYYIYWPNIMR